MTERSLRPYERLRLSGTDGPLGGGQPGLAVARAAQTYNVVGRALDAPSETDVVQGVELQMVRDARTSVTQ